MDYVGRGNQYLFAFSYDKVVIEYTEAIKIDPMYAEAYIGLVEAYLGMGYEDKAIETLELGYENTGDEVTVKSPRILCVTFTHAKITLSKIEFIICAKQ